VRHLTAILLFLFACGASLAADIHVVALTAGKAVVRVNGGKPQTLAAGQVSPEGVRLIEATSSSATFEYGGKRQTLAPGQGAATS
jgi:aspartyl protease family protein